MKKKTPSRSSSPINKTSENVVKKKSIGKKSAKKKSTRSGSESIGTTSPWGEEMFPEQRFGGFVSTGILIPKAGRMDNDLTFSPAASVRHEAAYSTKLSVAKPRKDVGQVLESRLKMYSTRSPQSLTLMSAHRAGMFEQMESLGVSACYFRSQKEHDDAMTELGDEYDYVSDFPLSLPARVAMRESPSARRSSAGGNAGADGIGRLWPEDSGVHLAHSRGILGKDVLIAVLDTGIDADHAEFSGRRTNFRYVSFFPNNPNWPPRDIRGFDVDGHGTHVSGILVGNGVGVAPESDLYVASVIESETTMTSLTRVVAGLQWVLRQFTRPDNERKPGVLNMSLGFPNAIPGVPATQVQGRLDTMKLLLQKLQQANILPVAAIGNGGPNTFGYPGAFDEVISVGAVDFEGKVAPFSGNTTATPQKPDLVGFGVGVNSAVERDYDNRSVYQQFNGTSMASPYVAGIAALYRSANPALTVSELKDTLLNNAKPLSGTRTRVGKGLARFKQD